MCPRDIFLMCPTGSPRDSRESKQFNKTPLWAGAKVVITTSLRANYSYEQKVIMAHMV